MKPQIHTGEHRSARQLTSVSIGLHLWLLFLVPLPASKARHGDALDEVALGDNEQNQHRG